MNKKWAFTFIELLIVIIIIGVLSVLAVPRFKNTFDSLQLRDSAKDIYYLLQYLQASAVAQSKIFCLNIDTEHGRFQAVYWEGEEGFKNLENRFGKVYSVPNGINVTVSPVDKTNICFYPDGNTDKTTITFENKQKDVVSLSVKGTTNEIHFK
ncbi:MAG: prepilin-type N-terminal cleavage/methylation domain-containing protein [Candidatus Omnitrophica bacterium]|nr:prepilin-type N-terminal cleavage/methylation domain-containing protein [Candidatus Omnitrophota bacterium]